MKEGEATENSVERERDIYIYHTVYETYTALSYMCVRKKVWNGRKQLQFWMTIPLGKFEIGIVLHAYRGSREVNLQGGGSALGQLTEHARET